MPFEDEIPPLGDYVALPPHFHELTRLVIGAAIAVHRALALLKQGIQRVIETEPSKD